MSVVEMFIQIIGRFACLLAKALKVNFGNPEMLYKEYERKWGGEKLYKLIIT